jgi:hypothetical protein
VTATEKVAYRSQNNKDNNPRIEEPRPKMKSRRDERQRDVCPWGCLLAVAWVAWLV